jgi:AraC-like DNA-binding protein
LGEQLLAVKVEEPRQREALDKLFYTARQLGEFPSESAALQVAGRLLRLLGILLQPKAGVTVPVQKNKDSLSIALDYISGHLCETVTSEQIAESCHLSKYHLCHRFRSELGMTVMQYLNDYRLSIADTMLKSTGKPIAEISWLCGFEDEGYFCRLYKKRFGAVASKRRENP